MFLLTDKSQRGEDRLFQDHNQTVTDLHKELQEKDEAYDKMNEEWEGRLMVGLTVLS